MKRPDIDNFTIRAEYEAGMSLEAIAAVNKSNANTIRRRLVKQGVPIRKRGCREGTVRRGSIRENIGMIRAMRRNGATLRFIAERIGVSFQAVQQAIKASDSPTP